MVCKKIVITALNLVLAIISYSFTNLFNMFDLLNTIFTSALVISLIIVLPSLYSSDLDADNENLLYNVNRVAYY